jgi:Flp pilus assembly protein TadG
MTVPLAFLLMFGIVQGGLYFHGRSVAHHAAQQAVDAQRAYDAADGAGSAAARTYLARMSGSLSDTHVQVHDDGNSVQVRVLGTVINLVPGWSGHVSQSVRAPVEKFRP